jgi:hypothetical protein
MASAMHNCCQKPKELPLNCHSPVNCSSDNQPGSPSCYSNLLSGKLLKEFFGRRAGTFRWQTTLPPQAEMIVFQDKLS